MTTSLSPLEQARAFDFVASWHEMQARLFKKMSEDEPRLAADIRRRAAEASQHHGGSAAALRARATDIRRAELASAPADTPWPGPVS